MQNLSLVFLSNDPRQRVPAHADAGPLIVHFFGHIDMEIFQFFDMHQMNAGDLFPGSSYHSRDLSLCLVHGGIERAEWLFVRSSSGACRYVRLLFCRGNEQVLLRNCLADIAPLNLSIRPTGVHPCRHMNHDAAARSDLDLQITDDDPRLPEGHIRQTAVLPIKIVQRHRNRRIKTFLSVCCGDQFSHLGPFDLRRVGPCGLHNSRHMHLDAAAHARLDLEPGNHRAGDGECDVCTAVSLRIEIVKRNAEFIR